MFETIMTAREQTGREHGPGNTRHTVTTYGSHQTYKARTTSSGWQSYSLLVQHYVKKHGGQLVHGIDNPVEVIVRVHESDQFTADSKTIIFDPWRTYPKADNVIYYGKYN
jgi:hypothetical protein